MYWNLFKYMKVSRKKEDINSVLLDKIKYIILYNTFLFKLNILLYIILEY